MCKRATLVLGMIAVLAACASGNSSQDDGTLDGPVVQALLGRPVEQVLAEQSVPDLDAFAECVRLEGFEPPANRVEVPIARTDPREEFDSGAGLGMSTRWFSASFVGPRLLGSTAGVGVDQRGPGDSDESANPHPDQAEAYYSTIEACEVEALGTGSPNSQAIDETRLVTAIGDAAEKLWRLPEFVEHEAGVARCLRSQGSIFESYAEAVLDINERLAILAGSIDERTAQHESDDLTSGQSPASSFVALEELDAALADELAILQELEIGYAELLVECEAMPWQLPDDLLGAVRSVGRAAEADL